ncbi:putative surface protein precursor [Streptococcus mitis]|uniref:Putative surface protein n=1 Tax=Streptococcus mitis TaxID=28037 RepID=A0A428HXY5_STRMT|nr:G5 domain-containing protein [Streptococcus mitis]RSK01245.1 putative surface protein precursor [Streptococcus mitis]
MKDIFNKRQRFSIRKFSVGVASVLIGIILFTPSQGVLASTENNLATEIGANSERENSIPTVEKKQESQSSPENRASISSPAPKDTPIISTRTTELETSGEMGNNSLTTRASVAGEDRSSTPAVRAASNPSEIKKYELTEEDAKKIKAGVIGSEGNKLDSLLLNGPKLSPEAYTDDDYLKDKDELYIYEKGGKKYVGYNSHPMLEDTDGDGIIDSKEKPDEKLKWNVSERDMIMFMELSYRDDNYIDRVLDHKRPLTESELYKKNGDSRPRYEYMMMNKELGPYWERKKSYHTSSGLDAVLYETKSDFLYLPNGTAQVLAFRGTSDAKDIGADIRLGTGSNPQQGIDAENIMRELAKDKSITNLYLTGHSLGGYLVQRAMVEAYQLAYSDSRVMSSKEQRAYRNFYNNVLKKGTTFNAPKVVTNFFSSNEFWQKGLDSKKIAKSGKMTHYIVDNDSTIRKGVSNDSDVVINVGRTSGGHSSRSYFEADMINRRSEFMSGKRISLDGTGYQDKKITTVKSVEKVGETSVYSKRGDDVIKSTTVSIKDPDTGQITKNTLDEVFKRNGAKSTVVVTPLEPSVRYEKDATRAKGEANVTTAGTPGTRTVTTTYTVNPTDGRLIPHEEPAVIVPSKPTVVKVPAKDEIEYLKEGDDVVKKTTTYAVNASTGALTPIEKKEVFKKDGAKTKVVVTPLEPSVRYEKDATRAKGEANVTVAGTPGTRTVTTTYTVNPTDGSLIPHEGQPVIKPSTPTVVKVPAKDKIEYLKEGDDVIKKTTTYSVNASTGSLTPIETREIFKRNGAKSTVVVTPLEPSVRYEKDATRAKGEVKITVAGIPGTRTVTTTYTVNSTDGSPIPHEEPAVVVPSKPTVVKVPAKDEVAYLKEGDDVVKKTTTYAVNASTGALTPTVRKEITSPNGAKSTVVVTPLESSVRYEKDATRVKGEAKITVAGTSGTSTVTTTYTVNPTDGSLIPHEGKPVIKPSTPTVVKVPAQDEVEYLKEGDDVVKKTTSYEVNASTGVLTPTVRKEITSPNGAKSTVAVTPLDPSVRYEKDATRAKGESKITVAGIPGTRTVTTTYTVNPVDGSLVPHEEPAVVVPSKPTVVKVPAQDEVEYFKEGDDVVKKTTSYEVNASTGALTPTVRKEITSPNGAKSTVVVTPLESSVRYEKDATRAKGESKITVAGTPGTRTVTTTYTVNPADGSLIPHEGQPVIKSSTSIVVKVPAKDEVEYLKDGDNVVKKTTTYAVNSSTGALTPTEKKEIFKQNGAKSTVAVTPLEPSVRYEKDATRAKGEVKITETGTPGTSTVTTTYTVNSTDGSLIPHEGKPVIKSSTPTVVKVPAKDEIEYFKEGDDVVKKTTSYEVNASTGALTPTVRKEITNPKGAKSKVVVTSLKPSVRYEKDATRVKGEAKITVAGTSGTSTVTTTYTVNPTDGSLIPHEGQPVIKSSTPTVVKVPAKDEIEYFKEGDDVVKKTTSYEVNASTGALTPTVRKEITSPNGAKSTVVVTPLESSVRYEKDATRAKGEAKITIAGTPGTRTVTITYTVNPTDGSLIPREEPAVVVPSRPIVVKVPAKDEVEYFKEGDDVVKKTTSYQVSASTGELTPTETTEIFKRNGAKSTVVVTPLEPSVRYEKDATRAKGESKITVAGTPGTRTVTTTYTVNPADGSLIPHEGQPVITPSTPTVVKVPAKDETEYLKEGDDVVKKTTTYAVNASTGALTPTVRKDITSPNGTKATVVVTPLQPSVRYEKDATRVKGEANVAMAGTPGTRTVTTTYTVNPADGSLVPHEEPAVVVPATPTVVKIPAKDKVVETPIEQEVEYVKDVEKDFGTPGQRTEGEKGKTVTTTTYDVDPKDGHITEHVGNPVITPAGKTIVKVGAKTKVEQSKDPEGRDVIDTTTYEVDPKTGKVTPTTVRTYGTSKEPTIETRPVPSPVIYEKDDTKEKGTAPTTVKGEDGEDTITTIYTVDPHTGKITASEGQPVRTKEPTNTIVKVAAKDKVETTEILSPKKYVKDDTRDKDQPNVEEAGQSGSRTVTTTYEVNPADGTITERAGEPVVVKPTETIVKVATKDKVVETPIEQEVEYVKDVEKDFGTPDQRTEGEKGKTVTTTTYDVDPNDGHITEHVGNPVVTPAGKTIVKVGAKTKVEQSKDSEGRDVIDTTSYEVDPKTGKVTPTTVRTYGTSKEPTVEKRVVPSPVVYEKDNTKEKDTASTTVKGEDGEDSITTTYTVEPNTGKITVTEDQPVRTKEPTNTVVKVPAKDKVVETPIEPEVEYVKDVEKDFGTPDQRTEGEKGKTVTITTYDVDPNDGHITEHVGNPLITPAGKTIVKVGAKTKVEQSKDSEGRDVIDTTSYEVDPKTGKVTPTTVRTYGTSKETKIELEQSPKPDDLTYPSGTKVEIPGEDGKGKVPNSDLPEGKLSGTSKITEPDKSAVEVPNVTTLAKVTIFENGVLADSIELPELMIEVLWIDEDGNVLKPSVKTGNEKDAGHGLIPGYEFVRTMIDENAPVMTHIFRKVGSNTNTIPVAPVTLDTPVTPATNGGSGQDIPAPTTPNAVNSNVDQVDTHTTIDNGAKSNDSQNVLPNTGTESNATLASLGLLGMLGGLGLALGKKKED